MSEHRLRGAMQRRYHPNPAPRPIGPSEYELAANADDEAHATAARLKAFWRTQKDGHRVLIRLVRDNGYLVVRSNLVNGLPPQNCERN
jgi:hypothetical protein